jgi:hypothetical protein
MANGFSANFSMGFILRRHNFSPFDHFAFVSGSKIPNTFSAESCAKAGQPTPRIAILGTQIFRRFARSSLSIDQAGNADCV